MEDDKPYNLASASWITRKADGISPSRKTQESWSESKGLRIQESQCAMSEGRQEKTDVSAQAEGQVCSFSTFLLNSNPHRIRWCPPALEVIFTQSTNWNTNLFQKYPHRHPRNNVSPVIWAQSSWHIESNHYTVNSPTSVPITAFLISKLLLSAWSNSSHVAWSMVSHTDLGSVCCLREAQGICALWRHGHRCIGKGRFLITLAVIILTTNSCWVLAGCNVLHIPHLKSHNNHKGN